MPTTPRGVWTPSDSDDWDLTVDWAANALSVDQAIDNQTAKNAATAAARDLIFPTPTALSAIYRTDKGWLERYYAAYNSSTNPGGATMGAGWYPVEGILPHARATVVSTAIGGGTWISLALAATPVLKDMTWSSGSSSRIVATVPGRYSVSGNATLASSATGQGRIAKNGASVREVTSPISGGAAYPFVQVEVDLAVNDYVELQVVSVGGGTLFSGNLQVSYMGPR